MICRLWHGWTTPENADAYEAVVRGTVIPGIEAMHISGFRHIDLMRRRVGDEVEFVTAMWFDDIESVKTFVGDDYEASHVPEPAQAVLERFDRRSAHYEVIDRRPQSPADFVPPDFAVPTEVTFGDLTLVPLGPEHNAADHAAWTSSIDHIRATPGFPDGQWPTLMSLSENLGDLERHAADFRQRRGFTYTVLDAGGDVVGCVYIYPSKHEHVDVAVLSWVRADRSDLDRPLYEAVRTWLLVDWPFGVLEYAERPAG